MNFLSLGNWRKLGRTSTPRIPQSRGVALRNLEEENGELLVYWECWSFTRGG